MSNSSRKYIIATLYAIIVFLLAANLFVVVSGMLFDTHYAFGWRFYFDRRLNFPFFFSLSLIVLNLFLLFEIYQSARAAKSSLRFWLTLFCTFFLFALDEAFYIHQHFKMSTFGTIASYDPASWTHYLWVIPYFLVYGILIAILVKQSRPLPYQISKKLVIAGFVFLSGAVAMEFAGTFYAVVRPGADIYILLIKSLEGTLQMTGSVMFANIFWKLLPSQKLN